MRTYTIQHVYYFIFIENGGNMSVQKYSYGGFVNVHKFLSKSSMSIIKEIKIENNLSSVINKIKDMDKYNDNIYEKFGNSCSIYIEKLFTETYLDKDKSITLLNELLIKEVKYLLLTNNDIISEKSRNNEKNFRKDLVNNLYEEFLQQEQKEGDEEERGLLYINKIDMANKLRQILDLYSMEQPEAQEIILSLIQIDTSKIIIDHKSINKNFDLILNSKNPYSILRQFFIGNEEIINESFLRKYWFCLKNLHLFHKTYNNHVLSILGDEFKHKIIHYIQNIICNKKQISIKND